MSGKKKFKLLDVILSVICVVFVAEAIAPAAAIGNQQFFWWIFLIITFLLPYGLIVSELGTAYADDEGGLYDWVRRAFFRRQVGRPRQLVLLDQLPPVDRQLGRALPQHPRSHGRYRAGSRSLFGHRARFYLDHHLHQLLPRL